MAADLGPLPLADGGAAVSGATLAESLEARFSAAPHVGVVTHFEGWDVPRTAAFALAALEAAGLVAEHAIEAVAGESVFNAAAPVAAGEGLQLWLVASPRPSVGTKLEVRVFHVMEDAAVADEYLAGFAGRLVQPRLTPHTGETGPA